MKKRSLVLFAFLSACTPMGVWLYEEPTVGLEDVLIDTSAGDAALPPYVILGVRNRNDFELSLRQIELELRIDGENIGSVDLDTVVTLAPITTRPVRVKVPPVDAAARGRIGALRAGVHRYGIAGRARLDTPIGERRIGFSQEIRAEAEAGSPTDAGSPTEADSPAE